MALPSGREEGLPLKLTYRSRRRLHRLGVTLGYLALAAVVVLVCWFVWLERFLVYTDNGAELRFDYESPAGTPQIASAPSEATVAIYYNEGDDFVNNSTELAQLHGYYADFSVLSRGVEGVAAQIQQLPEDSAVMLDVKTGFGTFCYSSTLDEAPATDQLDVVKMDAMIRELASNGTYLIARVSAFRDRNFGLNHTVYGLPVSSGAYLWADSENCYWLNPTSNGTLSRLISIASELREIGFDEVVFTDFRFPDTTDILFQSSMSRQEALESAAATLVSSCATGTFCVSFETDNASFRLPEGRSRLYLTGVAATEAAETAENANVTDPAIHLVYLTSTNDTRFDEFGVMRPMPGLN